MEIDLLGNLAPAKYGNHQVPWSTIHMRRNRIVGGIVSVQA